MNRLKTTLMDSPVLLMMVERSWTSVMPHIRYVETSACLAIVQKNKKKRKEKKKYLTLNEMQYVGGPMVKNFKDFPAKQKRIIQAYKNTVSWDGWDPLDEEDGAEKD